MTCSPVSGGCHVRSPPGPPRRGPGQPVGGVLPEGHPHPGAGIIHRGDGAIVHHIRQASREFGRIVHDHHHALGICPAVMSW
ncbi:MAG: hypothetical protein FD149_2198 [Rhodospirillaceae bacterium]|nr:MAG: hypothetical protein FD149_2198 [Rhodospirillaceae bacterium]